MSPDARIDSHESVRMTEALDLPDRRRLARRQRLQDAIDSLKQMRESRSAFGESELGSLPPAA